MIRTIAALSLILFSSTAWAETAATPKAEAPAAVKAAPAAHMDAKSTTDKVAGDKNTMEKAEKAVAEKAAADKPVDFVYTPKSIDLVFGKENAPVTLVEYASLSCPHCAKFFKEVMPELEKKYLSTGKVKLVYRNFPLNQPALEAAQLVHCAEKSAKQNYLKVLFSTQEKWAYDVNYHESLAGIAVLGGMERKKFDACIADKDAQAEIVLAYQEARSKFAVTSTPTLFLGNEQLKGDHSFAALSKALDETLKMQPKK